MNDQEVLISLTFRTPAPSAAVVADVIAAINAHAMPYDLTAVNITRWVADQDDADELSP